MVIPWVFEFKFETKNLNLTRNTRLHNFAGDNIYINIYAMWNLLICISSLQFQGFGIRSWYPPNKNHLIWKIWSQWLVEAIASWTIHQEVLRDTIELTLGISLNPHTAIYKLFWKRNIFEMDSKLSCLCSLTWLLVIVLYCSY